MAGHLPTITKLIVDSLKSTEGVVVSTPRALKSTGLQKYHSKKKTDWEVPQNNLAKVSASVEKVKYEIIHC